MRQEKELILFLSIFGLAVSMLQGCHSTETSTAERGIAKPSAIIIVPGFKGTALGVIEIELGIIAVSLVGLTAVLVPVLIRLGRVSEEVEDFLRHLNGR